MSALTPINMANFDLNRYTGKWYQFAATPMWYEPNGAHSISATYTLRQDGALDVFNELKYFGKSKSVEGIAIPTDKSNELRVVFKNNLFSILSSLNFKPNYVIDGILGNYEVAIVGSPHRQYCYILTRKQNLTCEEQERVKKFIKKLGYKWDTLRFTPNICDLK